ncbi:porin [Oxalicibacterium solurbis]|uniref:Porin n=1 Tax=Oxalicibacterium solurbis TaxID=69280 RepID=A0A8J3F5C7_9BURK|nr:porin [Oxalicibacterium solurbis]GGI55382.1 porin [Oxalicibacterium solurbis]
MKKSLLALAVLGAFAGAASAQSSVTIYGVVDTGFANIDQGDDAAGQSINRNGLESGMNSASRIGFKGIEDLGNGLKAEFVLENGISTDSGDGGAGFSRLAFVGLNGGFGKVRLGRQENQMKEMLGKIDTFGAAGIANAHDFIGGYDGLPQRQPNMVVWQSQNYGGFNGSLGYIFGEANDDNSANSGWGARLGYGNGPLNVQFAYQKQDETDLITDTNLVDPAGVSGDTKTALLGATYDFGAFKLHGLYGEKKYDAGLVATEDVKVRSGLIGVSVPFGASKIRAEYINNSNKDIDDADSDVWALSYTYAMSKRTTLYATYVNVSNDDGSTLGLGGGDDAAASGGETVSGFGIGINHKF